MHFTNKHNLRLDPALDGAAGGAAEAGSPAGGAAPAEGFDTSKFVPREDFERIQSDYSQFRQTAEQRFQDYDSRLPKPAKAEVKEDKEPDAESGEYDFSKPGEFQRYQRDLTQYHLKQNLTQREQQYAETQREEGYKQFVQKTQDAHAERADAFRAANPDYDPNKPVNIGNDNVTLAIMESEYSAHIHNFLQKNPDKLTEIRKAAATNPAAAIRMVGRIEAAFEEKADNSAQMDKAVRAKPTKAAFGGGGAKTPDRSVDDILAEWRPR